MFASLRADLGAGLGPALSTDQITNLDPNAAWVAAQRQIGLWSHIFRQKALVGRKVERLGGSDGRSLMNAQVFGSIAPSQTLI